MNPPLTQIPLPSPDRRLPAIPSWGEGLYREHVPIDGDELQRIDPISCTTVRQAMERYAEMAARRNLARRLTVESAEQTGKWTAYYGPITWTHNIAYITIGLYAPGTKPNPNPL
ncbi:MAG: hypothetical protein U0X20_17130 [Caldilineaceae bacterium]